MKSVWKFPFSVGVDFTIDMPIGSEIIHVASQHETPCLWAIIDADRTEEGSNTRTFSVFGTGHIIYGDALKYCGTFFLLGGSFIGHLFEDVDANNRA